MRLAMIKIGDLFDVVYGHGLELNRLKRNPKGVNFVSRTAKNNGISAKVEANGNIDVFSASTITVALGGSVLETFLQPEPFCTGYHIYCLTPRVAMTDAVKLYYCACIRANKYRYNYGRQANRTLKDILVPDIYEVPEWVNLANVDIFDGADDASSNDLAPILKPASWKSFSLSSLFDLKKGKRLTKANQSSGQTPYIGAIEDNNGVTTYISQKAIHLAGTITVTYNGSVAEAFYQPVPFWATDDVNVLYSKFEMTPKIGLFIATVIHQEKYRFNYGRKWHLKRMKASTIKLPAKDDGSPDFDSMERYINSLPYSPKI